MRPITVTKGIIHMFKFCCEQELISTVLSFYSLCGGEGVIVTKYTQHFLQDQSTLCLNTSCTLKVWSYQYGFGNMEDTNPLR